MCDDDPKSVREMIDGWKAKIAIAQTFTDYVVKKKEAAAVVTVEEPKIVKKATRLARSKVRGE